MTFLSHGPHGSNKICTKKFQPTSAQYKEELLTSCEMFRHGKALDVCSALFLLGCRSGLCIEGLSVCLQYWILIVFEKHRECNGELGTRSYGWKWPVNK